MKVLNGTKSVQEFKSLNERLSIFYIHIFIWFENHKNDEYQLASNPIGGDCLAVCLTLHSSDSGGFAQTSVNAAIYLGN